MDESHLRGTQRLALAANASERERRGRLPESVAVALGGETLVITLHGALSPAELRVAQTPKGAALIQEYYRVLFASACDQLRQEIERITGANVRRATGTVVHVFLLADSVPAETWSGTVPGA
jgi:uncharacterized protein YbcI